MKVTPRRARSDSAAAAIAASQAAALGPLQPPAHVNLRAGDRPFWDAIVQARPRSTWTGSDLVTAGNLARCQADIETLQATLDAEGYVVEGKAHPLAAIVENLTRRAVTLARLLMVHTLATVGQSEDIAKGSALERQARQEDSDDLIPTLRAVK